jgi:hypothetical protein
MLAVTVNSYMICCCWLLVVIEQAREHTQAIPLAHAQLTRKWLQMRRKHTISVPHYDLLHWCFTTAYNIKSALARYYECVLSYLGYARQYSDTSEVVFDI